jgi:hypothetical protein
MPTLRGASMALTDIVIRKARPGDRIVKLSDGGLQLWITPTGGKFRHSHVGQITPGGRGDKNDEVQPHAITYAPNATMRSEDPEPQALPVPSDAQRRCRMHGGPSPDAPKGNQNAYKHGRYSAVTIKERRRISALIRKMRRTAAASKQESPD